MAEDKKKGMLDFQKLEEGILNFWQDENIFQKTLEKASSKGEFVFYEGPPFANGLPGIHHVLARAFKDAVSRYKTMRGYKVRRKAGWDTHGLPTEIAAEKKLGINSKEEIEEVGVEKFIEACKDSVFLYIDKWEEMTKKMGYWIDLDNSFVTCSKKYIENEWGVVKRIWEKNLIYQDYKVIPYCPRCGTTLSSHEVAQGYKQIQDDSVYIKFKIKKSEGDFPVFLIVWTTTPWTLPGNVSLAVNKALDYVKIKQGNEYWILAEARLGAINSSSEIIERIKGSRLVGLKYESLFPLAEPGTSAYLVTEADFVSAEDGTGIVHIAPAFGGEDMMLAKKKNLPILITIEENGKISSKVPFCAGKWFKDANPLIVDYIDKKGLLVKKEPFSHDYPFCWRCKSPLIYYPKLSWFIKMSSEKVKKSLLENNQQINWIPSHLKEGRFGDWLENIEDWVISRERYWGTPIPIWECGQCPHKVCIGSIDELSKRAEREPTEAFKIHRPFIDDWTFKCEKCGGEMIRVKQVLDCWFDSGSMPIAQNDSFWKQDKGGEIDAKELIGNISFPADFICEGVDQTRGWFYSLLAISTLLDIGPAYKNVIGVGLVLDAEGKKMSKSKGNTIEPLQAFKDYGADSVRWYFFNINDAGQEKRFDPEKLKKETQKVLRTFWNMVKFYKMYADPQDMGKEIIAEHIFDKWALASMNRTVNKVTKAMEYYDLRLATSLLEEFIQDLSQWYLRCSRDRIRNNKKAQEVFHYTLVNLARMMAPFTPFFTEKVYWELIGKKHSIHLTDWPEGGEENSKLLAEMRKAREICSVGHLLRKKAKINLRQPLSELLLDGGGKLTKEMVEVIKKELNIHKLSEWEDKRAAGEGWISDNTLNEKVAICIELNDDLIQEGLAREMVRSVNGLRKEKNLEKNDMGILELWTESELIKEVVFGKYKDYLQEKTSISKIVELEHEPTQSEKRVTVKGQTTLLILKV